MRLGGRRGTNLELTRQIGERQVPQLADRTVLVRTVLRVENGRSGTVKLTLNGQAPPPMRR